MKALVNSFVSDQRGLALTEYLLLLGILAGGVLAGVLLANTALGEAWLSWASWITGRFGPN